MDFEFMTNEKERLSLAFERVESIINEKTLTGVVGDYFETVSKFILLLKNPEENSEYNKRLYEDILPENYKKSYGNPDYITDAFKGYNNSEAYDIARLLSFIYAEIRGLIPYAYEKNDEILAMYIELFIEIYVMFTDDPLSFPKYEEMKSVIYWFNSDNCDIVSTLRIRSQFDPKMDFATRIIMEEDLITPDYLYKFGEYISENEIEVSKFLASLPQSEIDAMASTFTEGYRIGFVKAGKPLDKKSIVNIRYNLGFERVIKQAIFNFEKMGLKPAIYRAASLSLDKKGQRRIGYYGAIPNKQFDYDHREDNAIYLDKDFVNRKVLVIKNTLETYKELASVYAGPAVMEVFGENPFAPISKETCITLDEEGNRLSVEMTSRNSQLVNEYCNGEETSFTIISYPIPEIGKDFAKIFADTVKLNTLDYKKYESMQQTIIDVLDEAHEVRIEGKGINTTNLTVKLHELNDPSKESKFENCVADVNIPVGEVFTSPVLKGTNGVLNVSKVYLNGLNYENLTITFKDGMIDKYSCSNFDNDDDNKKYINDNILFHHKTLPIGEFAIGTNTTAYRMARDYGIEERLPILIGEKTGPHFAVGDTCYSFEEDVKVYNPDGKEIIARDNEITAKYRETDKSKAYFNCHTDITIPYDELKGIYAIRGDGSETAIIEDGKFVLNGLEELNIPLN